MPLYQLWCDGCMTPYEVTMSLDDKEDWDSGKAYKKCPKCKMKLVMLICPPKTIKIN